MPSVTNSQKRKPNTLLIISILVLCVAILVPATLAWFTDQTDHQSTVTFGMIRIDDKSGYDGTQTVNALPGQSFAGTENCSVALAEGSEPVFIRAKITASYTNQTTAKDKVAMDGNTVSVPADDINEKMAVFVNSLNSLLTGKIKTTSDGGYAWTAFGDDGYYYLVVAGTTGGSATPLKVETTTVTYLFINKADMIIPWGLTNPSVDVDDGNGGTITVKNVQYGEVVDIKLIFEGVQAENLSSADYDPTAPTVESIEQFFDPNAAPNQNLNPSA